MEERGTLNKGEGGTKKDLSIGNKQKNNVTSSMLASSREETLQEWKEVDYLLQCSIDIKCWSYFFISGSLPTQSIHAHLHGS